jgi:hypothetical protein
MHTVKSNGSSPFREIAAPKSSAVITSVSFPGFPVPDFPGFRRLSHSRCSEYLYFSGILGIFYQMLRICLKIHHYVHEIFCKQPRFTIRCQPILHFGFFKKVALFMFY